MEDKEAVIEVIFLIPLEEVKSYSLGGEYIAAATAHFHKSWLVSWDLARKKVVLNDEWKFSKEAYYGMLILGFKNAKIFGNEVGGSFMDASFVESVTDLRDGTVLYSAK